MAALLSPPPGDLQLAEVTVTAFSAPETDAGTKRAPPAGLKRRRPLISGAPVRMAVAPAEEPPHKRQSLGNEPAPPCPAQQADSPADSALDAPDVPSAPVAAHGGDAAAPMAANVGSTPAALPAGVSVRRRKSRLAPKPAPVMAPSTASRQAKAPSRVSSGSRRQTMTAQVAETAAPARHASPELLPAAAFLALLPSPGTAELPSRAAAAPPSRLSLHFPAAAASVPASRLSLQLPAPAARRASVAPSAAPPPAARIARSRQSISFFHRECVSARTLAKVPTQSMLSRAPCTGAHHVVYATVASQVVEFQMHGVGCMDAAINHDFRV